MYEVEISQNTTNENRETLKLKSASIKIHKRIRLKSCRNHITEETKMKLEILFNANNYPGRKSIARISDECNMEPEKVRTWFANRRYRQKRLK